MSEIDRTFEAVFSPSAFQNLILAFGQELSAFFTAAHAGQDKTLNWTPPRELVAQVKVFLDQAPTDSDLVLSENEIVSRFKTLSQKFFNHSIQLHSPRYMGHQVPPSIPFAAAFELLSASTNQASGIYEMGSFSGAAERAMVQTLGKYIGWEGLQFDAIATHGGSLANLTAILAARNWRYSRAWEDGVGVASHGRPAIITSRDSHYCIARAAGIVGIGASQVLKAAIDSERRVDPKALKAQLDQAKKDGLDVFCIAASACTTPTGAFDPLDELAEIAAQRGIWLHVDGAHGASLLLSKTHRTILKGIEKADSITWDAHKMLFVPALSTYLFYKDAKNSYLAFDQDAPYLLDKEAEDTRLFDSAVRTVECTKRALSVGLFSVWSVFGPSLFEKLIDRTLDTTQKFYDLLNQSEDFAPYHQPQCNILCFRYLPKSIHKDDEESISALQSSLRKSIVKDGDFYITSTKLDGKSVLRVTLMNPFTGPEHLLALMEKIRTLASV